jgi:hypothetical protein
MNARKRKMEDGSGNGIENRESGIPDSLFLVSLPLPASLFHVPVSKND